MGIQGTHITLTVSDLDRSASWYQDLFGGQELYRGNDGISDLAVYALSDNLLVGLRRHEGMQPGDRFSHERCGLDHFALHVDDRSELEKWQAKFDEKNIDHSGIVESPFGQHLSFKDPDGIALELFVPAQQ
jgi:glyoxylase I family protein